MTTQLQKNQTNEMDGHKQSKFIQFPEGTTLYHGSQSINTFTLEKLNLIQL